VNAAALAAHQVRYEQKSYWRNPASAFFSFAFPILFLVIFATLNASTHLPELGGISYNQYYVPGIVAFGLMSACYTNLASTIAVRRDAGILKRLRGTPLPAWAMFAGMVGNSIVVSVILAFLVTAVGMLGYGVSAPRGVPALLLALALGAACFCALGVAVSTLIPNADAAPAVVNFLFFPLVFISGTFYPVPKGSVLERIADVFPLVHFTRSVFLPFDPIATGARFAGSDLAIVAAWAVAAAVVGVRRFRWEPARR
jgi:ABC-2 type transport system permease protein